MESSLFNRWKDSMDWEIKFDSYWDFKKRIMIHDAAEKGTDFDVFIDIVEEAWRDGIGMEISVTQHDPTP
jgi:hypothetical protein